LKFFFLEHERRCSKKHHQLYQKTINLSENFSEQSPGSIMKKQLLQFFHDENYSKKNASEAEKS